MFSNLGDFGTSPKGSRAQRIEHALSVNRKPLPHNRDMRSPPRGHGDHEPVSPIKNLYSPGSQELTPVSAASHEKSAPVWKDESAFKNDEKDNRDMNDKLNALKNDWNVIK